MTQNVDVEYPLFDDIYNDIPLRNHNELTIADAKCDVKFMSIRLAAYYVRVAFSNGEPDPECEAIIKALRDVLFDETPSATIEKHYVALYNAFIRPEFSFIFDTAIKDASTLLNRNHRVTDAELNSIKSAVGDIIRARMMRVNENINEICIARTMITSLLKIEVIQLKIDSRLFYAHMTSGKELINILKREHRIQPSEAIQSLLALLEPITKDILEVTDPSKTTNRYVAKYKLRDLIKYFMNHIKDVKPLEKNRRATALAMKEYFDRFVNSI